MNTDELLVILDKHEKWLKNNKEGIRADLSEADLRWANLREADLSVANLSVANLREANLYGAYLCEANLREANLCEASLCGANLCEANLREANLREANLCEASLCGANLHGANLRGANLHGANLCGANLRGANLHGANLYEAKGIRVITPDGSRGDMLIAVIHADGWRIKTGCFWGTLGEFESAVERNHADDKWGVLYRADIAMLRATEQVFLDDVRAAGLMEEEGK